MADQSLDTTRPLIMARSELVNGHELQKGDPISLVDEESDERAALTGKQIEQLFGSGVLIYADRAVATPVESPERYAARVTEVDDLGKGKYLIRAPWLPQGEEVAEAKLAERRQQVIDEGAAKHRDLVDEYGPTVAATLVSGTDGFEAVDKGGGNYEIVGPGLDEPIRVRGKQNAEDELAKVRAKAAAEAQTSTAADETTPAGGSAEVVEPAGGQTGNAISDAAPVQPPAGDASPPTE